MSLFHLRDWWSSDCGGGGRDHFDLGCLVVDDLLQLQSRAATSDTSSARQVIVVGSHEGVLRVYRPLSRPGISETSDSSGSSDMQSRDENAPTDHNRNTDSHVHDLLLEIKLNQPVLGLLTGRFITGSATCCLLVLSPRQVTVYTLNTSGGVSGDVSGGVSGGVSGDVSGGVSGDVSGGVSGDVSGGVDQYWLSTVYTHKLARSAFAVFLGDILASSSHTPAAHNNQCFWVQSLDGWLIMFQREHMSFMCGALCHELLVPTARAIHLVSVDCVLVATSACTLHAYKCCSLAHSDEEGERSASTQVSNDHTSTALIQPQWSYNLGEMVLDMQQVRECWRDRLSVVCVLSRCWLVLLSDGGSLLSASVQLQYQPSCMINYNNDSGELMSVLFSETGTMYMYCTSMISTAAGNATADNSRSRLVASTVLRWAARASCLLPSMLDQDEDDGAGGGAVCCVARANWARAVSGMLVLLSTRGCLSVCYLATRPDMSPLMPPCERGEGERKIVGDSAQIDAQLANLNAAIDSARDVPAADEDHGEEDEDEVDLLLQVDPSVMWHPDLPTQISEQVPCVRVRAVLTASARVTSARVAFHVDPPLCALPETADISPDGAAVEHNAVETLVFMKQNLCVTSLKLRAVATYTPGARRVATYHAVSGALCVAQCEARLPVSLVAVEAPPHTPPDTPPHRVTINTSQACVNLAQLLSDVAHPASISSGGCVTVRYYGAEDRLVTVLSSKSSQRYRLQSSDLHAIYPLAEELILRIDKLYGGVVGQQEEVMRGSCWYDGPLPMSGFISACEILLEARRHHRQQLRLLELCTRQLRAVQRRLLVKYKQPVGQHVGNLKQLLCESYKQLNTQTDCVDTGAWHVRTRSAELSSCTRLIQLLVRLTAREGGGREHGDLLRCLLDGSCYDDSSIEQGWHERQDTLAIFLYKCLLDSSSSSSCVENVRPRLTSTLSSSSAAPVHDTQQQQHQDALDNVPPDCGRLKRHLYQLLDKIVTEKAPLISSLHTRTAASDKDVSFQSSCVRPASARFINTKTYSQQQQQQQHETDRASSRDVTSGARCRRPVTDLSTEELATLDTPAPATDVVEETKQPTTSADDAVVDTGSRLTEKSRDVLIEAPGNPLIDGRVESCSLQDEDEQFW